MGSFSLEAVRYFWNCHGEHAPRLSATTRPCLHFHLRIFLSTGLKERQANNLAAILASETENMDIAHLNGKPAAGQACRIHTQGSTGEVYAFVANAASSGAKSAERF